MKFKHALKLKAEHAFQRVKPINQQEDKLMNEALIKRNQDLTPLSTDLTQLTNLITKITNVLDILILTPGDFDACVS
jgi:hypothetical protein